MRSRESGFSLVEALVALSIFAGALVSLALLFVVAIRSNDQARATMDAAILAAQKIEQLRALEYGAAPGGAPSTDMQTDTAASPERSTGGTGLGTSPASSLDHDVEGYVDYLDMFGASLGGGSRPPAGAVYTRRWSVSPLPADPANSLVIQVLVVRVPRATVPAGARPSDGARLLTVRTRRSP